MAGMPQHFWNRLNTHARFSPFRRTGVSEIMSRIILQPESFSDLISPTLAHAYEWDEWYHFLRRLRQLFILFIIYFSKHARGIFPHSWWNIFRLWRMSPPTVSCSSAASWMKSAESFSISILPPAMEGFLCISTQKCTATPHHPAEPIAEKRNYYLFSSFSFSLFSPRKSSTPPWMGGIYSFRQKKPPSPSRKWGSWIRHALIFLSVDSGTVQ